jgi:K+-transporting ATPase ATPase C chain
MRRQLIPSIVSMVIFTVLLGLAYPLVVTGVAQLGFGDKADGSLVERNGQVVGSSLIAQSFTDGKGHPIRKYFQVRPSAANYDPTYSTGSNLGPTNPELIRMVAKRAEAYRELNGLSEEAEIPIDAVTASGSGLDPDISVANARLQVERVAEARGLNVAQVRSLVDEHVDGRPFGIIGEKTVNVLDLNLSLDRAALDRVG